MRPDGYAGPTVSPSRGGRDIPDNGGRAKVGTMPRSCTACPLFLTRMTAPFPSSPPVPRYAVYFVPEDGHPLAVAGASWLVPGRPRTASPRRYGFHATLKAPMRLAAGVDEARLGERLQRLVAGHPAFAMPALQVAWLGDFLALRPAGPLAREHPLCRLADDCVTTLDDLRAPLTDAELARRRPEALSPRQRELLERWGYPHVLDAWRFHMTLSEPLGAVDTPEARALLADARAHFAAALREPLACRQVALCVEPVPSAGFQVLRRFPLAGG